MDRGPEPAQVEEYRRLYTQGWVNHYRNRMGQRGPDLKSHWGKFRDELADRFFGKCGYCERRCDGPAIAPTVDHFRPRSKFPELTYVWSNWVFACFRCNDIKANLWPDSGYVDPCAIPPDERPETYFEVDVVTGEIIAKPSLSAADKRKAQNTIDDVGLNADDVRKSRLNQIIQVRGFLATQSPAARKAFTELATRPNREFAGMTRMLVEQMQRTGEL